MEGIKNTELWQENGYQRCLAKAMTRAHALLREDDGVSDYGRIHSVKSILYAAIERAGMESERLITVRELLRELLMLVALRADPLPDERLEAFSILERLKSQHLSHREGARESEISNLKFEIK